jgi:hypothetical protein
MESLANIKFFKKKHLTIESIRIESMHNPSPILFFSSDADGFIVFQNYIICFISIKIKILLVSSRIISFKKKRPDDISGRFTIFGNL